MENSQYGNPSDYHPTWEDASIHPFWPAQTVQPHGQWQQVNTPGLAVGSDRFEPVSEDLFFPPQPVETYTDFGYQPSQFDQNNTLDHFHQSQRAELDRQEAEARSLLQSVQARRQALENQLFSEQGTHPLGSDVYQHNSNFDNVDPCDFDPGRATVEGNQSHLISTDLALRQFPNGPSVPFDNSSHLGLYESDTAINYGNNLMDAMPFSSYGPEVTSTNWASHQHPSGSVIHHNNYTADTNASSFPPLPYAGPTQGFNFLDPGSVEFASPNAGNAYAPENYLHQGIEEIPSQNLPIACQESSGQVDRIRSAFPQASSRPSQLTRKNNSKRKRPSRVVADLGSDHDISHHTPAIFQLCRKYGVPQQHLGEWHNSSPKPTKRIRTEAQAKNKKDVEESARGGSCLLCFISKLKCSAEDRCDSCIRFWKPYEERSTAFRWSCTVRTKLSELAFFRVTEAEEDAFSTAILYISDLQRDYDPISTLFSILIPDYSLAQIYISSPWWLSHFRAYHFFQAMARWKRPLSRIFPKLKNIFPAAEYLLHVCGRRLFTARESKDFYSNRETALQSTIGLYAILRDMDSLETVDRSIVSHAQRALETELMLLCAKAYGNKTFSKKTFMDHTTNMPNANGWIVLTAVHYAPQTSTVLPKLPRSFLEFFAMFSICNHWYHSLTHKRCLNKSPYLDENDHKLHSSKGRHDCICSRTLSFVPSRLLSSFGYTDETFSKSFHDTKHPNYVARRFIAKLFEELGHEMDVHLRVLLCEAISTSLTFSFEFLSKTDNELSSKADSAETLSMSNCGSKSFRALKGGLLKYALRCRDQKIFWSSPNRTLVLALVLAAASIILSEFSVWFREKQLPNTTIITILSEMKIWENEYKKDLVFGCDKSFFWPLREILEKQSQAE